jgi:putative hydrolase of the HAD superfamily
LPLRAAVRHELFAMPGDTCRAVLFDAVGTLIRLREPVGDTYARFAHQAGVDLPAARLQAAFADALRRASPMVFPGLPPAAVTERERRWWRDLVWTVFASAGAPERFDAFNACFARLWEHYAGAAAWAVTPGAVELLQALRARGLRTGMVSNFDHRLPALLDALGLAPLLDVVVLPADAGAAKPAPRIFAAALARLGVGAAATVYVGDDADDDIAGAERAGLRAVDVTGVGDLRSLAPRLLPE